MKPKFKLVKVKFSDGDKLCVKVINAQGEYYLDEDGKEWTASQIVSTSRTRNIAPEVKEAFFNVARVHESREEAKRQIKQLYEKCTQYIYELEHQEAKSIAVLRTSQGKLSRIEFCAAFESSLSPEVLCQMKKYGYRATFEPEGIDCFKKDTLYVERSVLVKERIREPGFPFVWEEFGGELDIPEKAKEMSSYRNMMKKYSEPLDLKSKLCENLVILYNDDLYYSGVYKIPIDPHHALTKQYAVELANNFS